MLFASSEVMRIVAHGRLDLRYFRGDFGNQEVPDRTMLPPGALSI